MRDEIEMLAATLGRMTVTQLRDRFSEVFGEQPRTFNRNNLIKRIAWRVQADREGGLSERALRRAEALARDSDLRLRAPVADEPVELPAPRSDSLTPGTLLRRVYKGRTLLVRVMADGFEFEGERYRSLSAIAKVATGTHWGGRHFFGLKGGGHGA